MISLYLTKAVALIQTLSVSTTLLVAPISNGVAAPSKKHEMGTTVPIVAKVVPATPKLAVPVQQPVAEAQPIQQTTDVPVSTPVPATAVLPTGSHEDWMAEAGIDPSDYGYVDYIISHESGWNPDAINNSSGATGLPQALPYSKTGCAFGDAICQLQWATSYATSRYGSWAAAYSYWTIHRYW